MAKRHWVMIDRAPVLTLWAAIVAERLGFDKNEALTLGRAVAGLNVYSILVLCFLAAPALADMTASDALATVNLMRRS